MNQEISREKRIFEDMPIRQAVATLAFPTVERCLIWRKRRTLAHSTCL